MRTQHSDPSRPRPAALPKWPFLLPREALSWTPNRWSALCEGRERSQQKGLQARQGAQEDRGPGREQVLTHPQKITLRAGGRLQN